MINIQVALADSTDYNPAQFPELQLRQSWHQAGVPSDIRVRLAGVGLTQLDLWANLGETAADFLQAVHQLLGGEHPTGEGATAIMNNTRLVSAWKKARSLQNSTDSLRQDLTKDPLRTPEMSLAQYNDLRAKFLESHMDAVMLEHREPNKRFVERVARDLLVHDVVLPYHLHEVRLRSETIQQRPGFSAGAERLLQVSQEDLPATVNSEDDALNRIHALYTTFEYVGVLAFSKSQVLSGKHVGGALDFIQASEMKRQETPGLHFIVQADYRIRKKVHKLMTEDRHLFPTFAVALHHTPPSRAEHLDRSSDGDPPWLSTCSKQGCNGCRRTSRKERPRSSTQHQQEGWKQFSARWQQERVEQEPADQETQGGARRAEVAAEEGTAGKSPEKQNAAQKERVRH